MQHEHGSSPRVTRVLSRLVATCVFAALALAGAAWAAESRNTAAAATPATHAASGRTALRPSSANPALAAFRSLLPSSADVVLSVDLKTLRASPLGPAIDAKVESFVQGDSRGRFSDQTGIDLKRDVDTVLAVRRPSGGSAEEGLLVLAKGRFSQTRIAEKAAAAGWTSTLRRGVRSQAAGTPRPHRKPWRSRTGRRCFSARPRK